MSAIGWLSLTYLECQQEGITPFQTPGDIPAVNVPLVTFEKFMSFTVSRLAVSLTRERFSHMSAVLHKILSVVGFCLAQRFPQIHALSTIVK